jgi:NAD+ synthase (glutamine-hydrolysing)
MDNLKICLAQVNTTVGDIEANFRKIVQYIHKAKISGADIVVFPELSLCGYPPEDLLLKPHFIKQSEKYINKIINKTDSVFVIVGFPYRYRRQLFNAAALVYNKKLIGVYKKVLLPNYGVFDEVRYFRAGCACPVVNFRSSLRIGVNICEDIWYPDGPPRKQAHRGRAKILINISSSPYHAQKINLREKILAQTAKKNRVFVFYCNSVGGQDELVFDGASMAFDNCGNLIARAKQFQEDLLSVTITGIHRGNKKIFAFSRIEKKAPLIEEIYSALTLGLRDYVVKNGFKKIVFGLSGGIDSALVAVLAVDALGKDNVTALTMPSQYSSRDTQADAKRLARNLGIKLLNIPIDTIYKTYLKILSDSFKHTSMGITEENIQARIRGNIVMAFSNKFGWLVVTTGNKSELSVGYCTLYGDTVGGFAVIKDVPKTLVYKLAQYRNSKADKEIIPAGMFLRPPSAELRPHQKDEDNLPPYSLLDRIIDAYVEKDEPINKIIKRGFKPKLVRDIVSRIDRSEYKRRQYAVGVKITPKAFGKDRRMPITNRFYE